jgi:serine/threonine-protein kinase RsbW
MDMHPVGDNRDVSITVPAKAEYVLLARLALSAVCRMTPLQAVDVADLKLAVTEAASSAVGTPDDPTATEDDPLRFNFRLEDDRLVMEIVGPGELHRGIPPDEQELSRAIVEATVDECEFSRGNVRLVKYLSAQ